jgi:predicted amidohydrolase
LPEAVTRAIKEAMMSKGRGIPTVYLAKGKQQTVTGGKISIASIQVSVGDASKESNLGHVEELLSKAKGSDLIILPELWNIGYFSFSRYRSESESPGGPTLQMIQRKAIELGAHILTGGIVESSGEKMFNTSYFVDPQGRIAGKYSKMHLFGYGSQESKLLSPGRDVVVVHSDLGKFGLSTCYDLRFPELYRRLLDMGAEAFLVSSAWPSARLEHWQVFNRARAIENQSFLISSNCCGVCGGVELGGHSMIVDPNGKVVAEAGGKEHILKAVVDLSNVQKSRSTFPAVKDRVLNIDKND